MASASFSDQLPQATSSVDPFTLADDKIREKVVETHIAGDENYNVESLFNVAENIIKRSTQTADTYLLEGTAKPVDSANDKPFPENISLPLSKIEHIGYEMTSKPACDKDHAHQTTMTILYQLERSHWVAKVAITLAAFAKEYGNFWHLAQIQSTADALGKSLALLNGGLFVNQIEQRIETQKPDLTELNNLVKRVLHVTKRIIKLEKFSTVGYDQKKLPELFKAIEEIPVDIYWIIITIAVCATRIAFPLGDSNKLQLSEFDRKLHSILAILTKHVTKIGEKIDDAASKNISLVSSDTNIVDPFICLGERKNIFYCGKIATVVEVPSSGIVPLLNRKSFPDDFTFGTATSAYQIEGAFEERDYSAWDHFTHTYPEKIKDQKNGDIACDALHHIEVLILYQQLIYEGEGHYKKKDVKLMKDMNVKAYRFSISWPRIIKITPGNPKGEINEEGIAHYNALIDCLKKNGLTPFVTLFHVDRHQALEQKENGGFLSRSMVDDFRYFVNICFERFGEKVKHWITLNEPYVYCYAGYVKGIFPPGHCKKPDTEPYTVAHNLLLAHAHAVDVYRKSDKSKDGVIGITLDSPWIIPYSKKDQEAADRALDFILGWFMEPLTGGAYPKIMQDRVKERLPAFTEYEKQLVKGSFDFIGINYYTAMYAANRNPYILEPPGYDRDTGVRLEYLRRAVPIGEPTASGLHTYPEGIRKLLLHIKKKYKDPIIYVTENGVAPFDELASEEPNTDTTRTLFHHNHLHQLLRSIKIDHVQVKGYFLWSLLDNFEWNLGYTVRFGMYSVDFEKEERPRAPKKSAKWFKRFLKN